jgi:integrase/recombinase XerD
MEQLLDQFLHYLIVEKGLSRNTIEAYSHGLTRFLNYLREKGVQEVQEVGKFHIRGFLLALREEP